MHNLIASRIGRARKKLAIQLFGLTLAIGVTACHDDDPALRQVDAAGVERDAGAQVGAGSQVGVGSQLDAGRQLDAGSQLDAGGPLDAASATGDAGWSDLQTAVKGVVADYDEQVRINCSCFVQMGAYTSVEECFKYQGSGPDWVPCATRFLAQYDTPDVHEVFRCYQEHTQAGTKCLAMTACDANERAKCPGASLECFQSNPSLGLMLAMACPDISLLPRLTP